MPNKSNENKMNRFHLTITKYSVVLLLLFCSNLQAREITRDNKIKGNDWEITYNPISHAMDYSHNGSVILKGVYAKAKIGTKEIESRDFKKVEIRKERINDLLGKGAKYIVTYSNGPLSTVQIEQNYYFYSHRNYFLTEVFLLSTDGNIASNYIAPLYTLEKNSFLPQDTTNRALRVPYDNDAFVSYLSAPLKEEIVSFEVTSIFNGLSRNGLVIGSVEHDTWKTGICYHGEDNRYITKLECFGGITHELTRDISNKPNRPSKEHGSIQGKRLKSPKILVGFFNDWRKGMELFGEVNAAIAPPRQWEAGTPFGWNSWAAMAEKVNFEGAVDVSDFIKKELQPDGFENQGITYIGLDSFWDNFNEEQLIAFARHCKENGQKAGIYWCPFSDWHGNADGFVEGTNRQWKYKDIYLYANGHPRRIESLAVDPTHPGTKQRMKHYIDKFKQWGYTYIKLDFINNGTLEADSFHNPNVTTGTQAYNEGMHYLGDLCGEDLFLALSIAPIFPSQYGNSRRISCDTWGAMSEKGWGTTNYMLNSLSFGWWLDRVYSFNDADHILLYKPEEADNYKEGANRARITSAVITGIYMLGDNFSSKGSLPGNAQAREKAKIVATNQEINAIAHLGKSFYPIEGYTAQSPEKAENMYMLDTEKYIYIVVFNFHTNLLEEGSLDLQRIGYRKTKKIKGKELWTSTPILSGDGLHFSVPPQDVRVYQIEK